MSLADKFGRVQESRSGLPCGVSVLLTQLSKSDREAFEEAMNRDTGNRISNRQIHDILRNEGHNITWNSIASHRRMQCRCFAGKGATNKPKTAEENN